MNKSNLNRHLVADKKNRVNRRRLLKSAGVIQVLMGSGLVWCAVEELIISSAGN